MSDLDVLECLASMEALLAQEPFPLDPGGLDAWQARFEQALASAEQGPQWESIRIRAREVHHQLMHRLGLLETERDQVRAELSLGAQGARALKGYAPAPRF